jgi:hypothetical protein
MIEKRYSRISIFQIKACALYLALQVTHAFWESSTWGKYSCPIGEISTLSTEPRQGELPDCTLYDYTYVNNHPEKLLISTTPEIIRS